MFYYIIILLFRPGNIFNGCVSHRYLKTSVYFLIGTFRSALYTYNITTALLQLQRSYDIATSLLRRCYSVLRCYCGVMLTAWLRAQLWRYRALLSLATVLLQRCYDTTTALLRCYYGVAVATPQCCYGLALALYGLATVLLRPYSIVAMALLRHNYSVSRVIEPNLI